MSGRVLRFGLVIDTLGMDFLGRALELAEGAIGGLAPRPAVGAVVVAADGETVVGEGATAPSPGPHAEAVALGEARGAARGGTIYCTLEPHQHVATTPPCTQAIVDAGIRRVVCPVVDPNPVVSGRGFAELRDAGVEVSGDVDDVSKRRAEELIEGFAKHVRTGLPFVTMKWAMSLDGKIATRSGDSQWITGEEARGHAHKLRYRSDVVMTGIGTVLADDPRLTARDPDSGKRLGNRPMRRVVVDSNGRLPPDAAIFGDEGGEDGDVIQVVASGEGVGDRCEVWKLPDESGETVDLTALMRRLGELGVHNVLVEAGSRLNGELIDRKLVDKVVAYVSTAKLIGGGDALSPVGGAGARSMRESIKVNHSRVEPFVNDLAIIGYVDYSQER